MDIVVQPCYFAPVYQYSKIIKAQKVIFEIFDNYQKQTFRNRCYIAGAQGKLMLNVPVKHTKNLQRKRTQEAQIDYESICWQKLHIRSLQTAYRSSPYFDFFEQEILDIFNKKHKYLLDLNFATHEFVMEALQEIRSTLTTQKYQAKIKNDHTKDLRYLVNA